MPGCVESGEWCNHAFSWQYSFPKRCWVWHGHIACGWSIINFSPRVNFQGFLSMSLWFHHSSSFFCSSWLWSFISHYFSHSYYLSVFLEVLAFLFLQIHKLSFVYPKSVMWFYFISAFVWLFKCFVFFYQTKHKWVWFIKPYFQKAGIFQELSKDTMRWYYYSPFLKLKLFPFCSQWSDWMVDFVACVFCYLNWSFLSSVFQGFLFCRLLWTWLLYFLL